MDKSYYDFLRKKIDASIQTEENSELKDIKQRICDDIYEIEFLTLSNLAEYEYRLVDFLQDVIALKKIELQPNFKDYCACKEREENQRKLKYIQDFWDDLSDNKMPEISKIFKMSENELQTFLKKKFKEDELDG